jgi:16S rRNA (guanine527-N7)-methyltransferase
VDTEWLAERAGVSVSRETCDRLKTYVSLVTLWSQRINLVSRSDLPLLWERHIADSLQLLPLMGSPQTAIDLGSGAGLPAIPLAIASGIPFELIEADQRKASFLREAARATSAPARVHAGRAELARLPRAALVTARALAPLDHLLTLAEPLLSPGGRCLFPKGARAEDELTVATRQWHMRVERFPSRTDPTGTILRISQIQRAEKLHPSGRDRQPEGRGR